MIDKNTQMMDAGTRLFDYEKPFGTALGGISVRDFESETDLVVN